MDEPKTNRRRRSRRGGRKRSTQSPKGQVVRRKNNGRQSAPTGARSVPKGQLPNNFIYGINPIAIALDLSQLKVMFFDKGSSNERLQHLHAQALNQGVEIRPLQQQGWRKTLSAEMHQGVAGLLMDQPNCYLEEIVMETGEDSCILVLDRIQDPQNLGAVLRTAAATGVDAVVLPKAGGCPITPAVHKASAGQSLRINVVEDENLAQAIDFLKDHGYWVVGCDSGEGEDATIFEFPKKRVIVMGNEAEGMRRLVREHCDYIARIPMAGDVESLNISVATAVVLYLAQADLKRAEFEENGEGDDNNSSAAIPESTD